MPRGRSKTQRGDAVTPRQKEIYNFICDSMKANGSPPTIREINVRFGFTSDFGAVCHLKAMVKKGWLVHHAETARGYVPNRGEGCCRACGRKL